MSTRQQRNQNLCSCITLCSSQSIVEHFLITDLELYLLSLCSSTSPASLVPTCLGTRLLTRWSSNWSCVLHVHLVQIITYSSKEDVEEDNSHKRADVEDTTEHEHQNIPPLVIILLSTSNPAMVRVNSTQVDKLNMFSNQATHINQNSHNNVVSWVSTQVAVLPSRMASAHQPDRSPLLRTLLFLYFSILYIIDEWKHFWDKPDLTKWKLQFMWLPWHLRIKH